MPSFKPAYLIHGDDHGRIAERRARLRAMAEVESGTNGVEVFEGETCTADAIVGALTAMTFAMGRRFVIADGVERWKDAEAAEVAGALKSIDPDAMTVAFFAREDGRAKASATLHKAVTAVGGAIACESAVKAKELPVWVRERAAELRLQMDVYAARALVARVGERQQRLLRELEKLALELGEGATVTVEEVEGATASSAERKSWVLGDALVAGNRQLALRTLVELRGQGERVGGLLYRIVNRLRDANDVAMALQAGESRAAIKGRMRMAPWAAERLIDDVARREPDTFRRALALMADVENESRGGGGASLSEDTMAVRALVEIAG
jgi:DNA polymerase III subunit delta